MKISCVTADALCSKLNSLHSILNNFASYEPFERSVSACYNSSVVDHRDTTVFPNFFGNSAHSWSLRQSGRPKRLSGISPNNSGSHFWDLSPNMSMAVNNTQTKFSDLLDSEPSGSHVSEAEPYFTLSQKPLSCPRWRRVLLKVSGEALAGDGKANIDPTVTSSIAREVAAITRLGVEVAIVVGGGNFFRGASWAGESGLDRASADQIGMMATVMNAIFLQGSLESIGIPTRVQTAFRISEIAEPYIRRRAIRHLEKGRVVIFAAGTGNPFFTTDTAAALRAAEINAEVVLKGTNVDGVYDSDPKSNPNAILFQHLSHREVTVKKLCVMDATAITLCSENNIPIVVFNLNVSGNITKALGGESIGTLIDNCEWP